MACLEVSEKRVEVLGAEAQFGNVFITDWRLLFPTAENTYYRLSDLLKGN